MLNGRMSAIFNRAFAGLYLPATLHKREMAYDDDGNPTATETDYPCRAQVDSVTESMRQAAGYTDSDVAIYILDDSLGTDATSNDDITVNGVRRSIASVERDPAGAYFLLRGQLA